MDASNLLINFNEADSVASSQKSQTMLAKARVAGAAGVMKAQQRAAAAMEKAANAAAANSFAIGFILISSCGMPGCFLRCASNSGNVLDALTDVPTGSRRVR